MNPRLLTLFALVVAGASCARETRVAAGAPAVAVDQHEHPYPQGTVGGALNGYWVNMPGIRKWYKAMAALSEHVERNPSYHLSLQMPFESPLEGHLVRLSQDSVVRQVIAASGLSIRDFVLLTGVVGIERMTRHLVDSLGPSAAPSNVGKELSAFFSANRREIDSLEAALR